LKKKNQEKELQKNRERRLEDEEKEEAIMERGSKELE